ncbi:MAG TPA: TonB-dependent receptor [Pyrinomonadaceae bacterium]|jgi:iron complex outermembrane receptor protein
MTVSKRQRHLFNFGLFFLFAAMLLAPAVSAQNSTSVLQGVVTDENQAIIPEAKIVLRDEKGGRREIVSGIDGSFSFKDLAFGKYVLMVEKDGFTAVKREIVLSAPEQNSDLTLAPSAVSESVTIVLDSAEMAVESTLKLPVSIRETPRSISVIGSERIREQNFRQVSDLVTYVPGTTPNSYRNGSYHFYSRGYRMAPDDTRLDGFSGVNVGSGGFGASMFGIEEAVILRGPASLVYGQTSAPGGFINLISKKPQAQRFTRVDLRGGGYAGNGVSLGERPSFGIDFDTTGAFTKSERVLYRALFTLENTNYFTANTLDRNRYANASVAFKLDEEGRYILTPSVQYTRYNRPYGGGVVISPTTSLRTNDGINSPIRENDLSPLDVNLFGGRRIEKTGWAGIDFRGVVSEKIRVNAAYRFVSFNTDINSFTPQVTTTAQINQLINQNTVSRIQAKSLTERRYNNFNADASYEWLNTGWWKNTTQIGFYERVLNSRATAAQGAIPAAQSPINIYTGQALSPLVDNFPPIAFGAWGRDIVWNGFVQNRTSLDNGRWNFTLGLNYGQNNPATGAVRKSDLMPNASVVFNATPEFTFYASYSTSFNPVDPDLEDAQGNRGTFAPTLGSNYEIGAKYDLFNRRVSMTLALFQNQIDNALVQSDVNILNPRGNRYYTPAGTRRARGAEMTGEFQVRQDLRISGGVSYLDAIYKGFPASAAVSSSPIPNSRAEKSPRWAYNIYSRYDRSEGFLKGFGAGLGLFWQGKRLGSNGAQTFAAPDPLVLPSYTRVDSALFYRLNKHVNFAFNVENMFDELIYVNASVGSSIEIAAPRTMTFRTTFNF